MVNTGNTRRESAQAYLIPLMREAGFDVVADNCEALPCVFETRLPSLDYDLAMYISTVAPDPAYLTQTNVCDQIPNEANDFQGQNSTGWCNEEATEQLKLADTTIDEDLRTEEVRRAIELMREDWVLLPTLQFPNIGAYRTDTVANTQGELANYQAINDWYQWEDVDGDGQIVIGAEQFPTAECPNPITECSNSSWYQWVAGFAVLPGAFRTTNDLAYVPSEILAGEPVVEEL
jgi:ABC-type transport system substrate-binding protein